MNRQDTKHAKGNHHPFFLGELGVIPAQLVGKRNVMAVGFYKKQF